MLDFLTSPEAWASFATLAVLEVVLGIDNIIFLSIVTAKLPKEQQPLARRIGLFLALAMRIALLSMVAWIVHMTDPLFSVASHEISLRDIIMLGGGLFLLFKGTSEIHSTIEGHDEHGSARKTATFAAVVAQIVVLDLVFSIDSVITAVGMADHLAVMIAAVVFSILVMLFAAEPVSAFVNAHPSVKMLALSFIMLIGMALIADGLHFHIPRGYMYFAISFSLAVEVLNLMASKARAKHRNRDKAA